MLIANNGTDINITMYHYQADILIHIYADCDFRSSTTFRPFVNFVERAKPKPTLRSISMLY